jgi:hypothetical protein
MMNDVVRVGLLGIIRHRWAADVPTDTYELTVQVCVVIPEL